MKQSAILEKYTDYISDRQNVLVWGFNSNVLQKYYNTSIYSLPVEIQLFRALKKIAESEYKTVWEKRFTVFMGDFGSAFELFGVGITGRNNTKVAEIFTGCFEEINGYVTMENGRIPWVPLIPCYRYENGLVIEYTDETRIAGKFRKGNAETSGLKVLYRVWESAEGLGVKERYCDSTVE